MTQQISLVSEKLNQFSAPTFAIFDAPAESEHESVRPSSKWTNANIVHPFTHVRANIATSGKSDKFFFFYLSIFQILKMMFFLQIYSTKLMKNIEFFEFAESPVLGRAGSAAFIRHGAVNRSELNDSRFFKTAARIGRNFLKFS